MLKSDLACPNGCLINEVVRRPYREAGSGGEPA